MRFCTRCKAPDSVVLTSMESCDCGADGQSFAQNNYAALDSDHHPDCARVQHFVVRDWVFPFVYRPRDLAKADANDRNATHGYLLPMRFRKNWRLVERPGTSVVGQSGEIIRHAFARVRTLCRDCIAEETAIAGRVREYERRRAEMNGRQARGKSWAEALSGQDTI